jgi:cytochrome oxidase Cu insertion factor (SCO1/SenC/PrrC family)
MNAPAPRPVTRTAWWVLFALGVLLAGIWFGRAYLPYRGPAQAALGTATLLPVPRPLSPFSLRDQRDAPFTLAGLQGRWSLKIGRAHV